MRGTEETKMSISSYQPYYHKNASLFGSSCQNLLCMTGIKASNKYTDKQKNRYGQNARYMYLWTVSHSHIAKV